MNLQPRETVQWKPAAILNSKRVAEMPLIVEGAYRRSLDIFYHKGYLPNDVHQLAKAIGKDCTIEIAKQVKSMYRVDPDRPGILYHDFVKKLPPVQVVQTEIAFEADESERLKVKAEQAKQKLFNDRVFIQSIMTLRTLDETEVKAAIEEFFLRKVATLEFKQIERSEELRRYLINFIPFSEVFKQKLNGSTPSKSNSGSHKLYSTSNAASSPTERLRNW